MLVAQKVKLEMTKHPANGQRITMRSRPVKCVYVNGVLAKRLPHGCEASTYLSPGPQAHELRHLANTAKASQLFGAKAVGLAFRLARILK